MCVKPIAIVDWRDATSHDGWESLEEASTLECNHIRTVGFLLHSDLEHVVVTLSIDLDEEACANTIAIPKLWIQSMRLLPLDL